MQPRFKHIATAFRGRRAIVFSALLATIGAAARPVRLSGQSYARLDLGGSIEVGGEAEHYARVLELAGLVPLTPWSIQPFTPSQVRDLRPTGPNPWAERFAGAADMPATSRDSTAIWLLRPSLRLIGNSAFPFQVSGGPTWAGRGLTADIQAGAAAHWGPVYAQAAPLAFAAENAPFALAPNGLTGNGRFADPRFPGNIDAPQRFGSSTYARLEPGTSSLVLDGHHLVAGVSSAPQQWGPAREYPLVLGPNAGGFPSVFVGSSEPWNFWLFRGHGRLVYGELGQSAYAAIDTSETRRLGSGIVLVAEPRGAPGLEIGASRFLHRPWGDFSASTLERPFSSFLNGSNSTFNEEYENEMASLFARWALPRAKAEFYGEFYKEDYIGAFHQAADNLVEAPDDYSAFSLGFQHLLVATGQTIRVLRAELVSAEVSPAQRLQRGFNRPLPPYIHSAELQGHTLDGLILGSPEAYGGAGWTIGLDEYTQSGRRSLSLQRALRLDWLPTLATDSSMVHPDVAYSLRADFVRFHGARELGLTIIPTVDLNRNLIAHHDVINLTAAVNVRGW